MYTHYWNFKKPVSSINDGFAKFEKAVRVTKECISMIPKTITTPCYEDVEVKLRGGDGTGNPIFKATEIVFNGDASKGFDHETFYMGIHSHGFDFCKTARKPYDLAVCIAILCFSKIFGKDFTFNSDGNMAREENWPMARNITKKYFQTHQ